MDPKFPSVGCECTHSDDEIEEITNILLTRKKSGENVLNIIQM